MRLGLVTTLVVADLLGHKLRQGRSQYVKGLNLLAYTKAYKAGMEGC